VASGAAPKLVSERKHAESRLSIKAARIDVRELND